MPNWCENRLKITGDKDEILKFIDSVKGKTAIYPPGEKLKEMYSKEVYEKQISEYWEEMKNNKVENFVFNSLVPVPEDTLKKGFDPYGYDWQVNNWGTKWDVNGEVQIVSQSDEEIVYDFSTAWSPPIEWVLKVSDLFPKLEFELSYFEPGVFFAGSTTFSNGDVIEEIQDDNLEGIKEIMVNHLGYSQEDADDFFDFGDEEEHA